MCDHNTKSSASGSQTRHAAVSLLSLSLEGDLNPELLVIFVKPSPILALGAIDLASLKLEGTSLVGLSSDQQVLELLVRLLDLLLKSRHESDSGLNILRDLRILQLEQQTQLPRQRIPSLCDLVPRSSNLDNISLDLDLRQARQILISVFSQLCFSGSTSSQIGLMFASLGVCEIGTVVLVYGQTQATFETADVVLEDVGVFVQIDCFEGEFAEAFAAVGICCAGGGYTTTSKFGACAVLKRVSRGLRGGGG